MKKMKLVTAMVCLGMLFITACKNDKTDDTVADTAILTTAPVIPVPDTMKMSADTTAMHAGKEAKLTPAVTAPASGSRKKEATIDTRTKKTSRKGRIVLASLQSISLQDKMEVDKEGIYNRAEIMPAYPGGENALRNYIENNIRYPETALDNGVEGTVKVYFAVDENGKVYTPSVISQKLGYGLDEEALRVIRQMPKWTPGQIKGKNVKTHFTLPITYKLD